MSFKDIELSCDKCGKSILTSDIEFIKQIDENTIRYRVNHECTTDDKEDE